MLYYGNFSYDLTMDPFVLTVLSTSWAVDKEGGAKVWDTKGEKAACPDSFLGWFPRPWVTSFLLRIPVLQNLPLLQDQETSETDKS